MNYKELKDFLENRMRMSHIYQPLLIKTLVELGGIATVRHLAMIFLDNDESQIQYYEKRLKEMPIKVLSAHDVISRDDELVRLNVKNLTLEQKAEIKKICEAKIQEYITSRGMKIWDYRLLDGFQVPDSVRYQVLKEGGGHCALCGATVNERPMDVDHIIPRSKGGKTEYSNLQVMCSKCNRSKRNTDDTDLRKRLDNEFREDCPFCRKMGTDEVIIENEHAFAVLDKYPVTEGHTLIIPRRHFPEFFQTTQAELADVYDLLKVRKKIMIEKDDSIEGFNVGVNSGEVAGQTIFHVHIHLIPRRKGDVAEPRGGVRGVIPKKQKY